VPVTCARNADADTSFDIFNNIFFKGFCLKLLLKEAVSGVNPSLRAVFVY
jgi:hypothetical protein